MNIAFKTNKMEKCCSNQRDGIREWGDKCAKKIRQRLVEFRAADTLADISFLPPPRCHPLGGDKSGLWAVDLVHPFRLLFSINQDPVPMLPNGEVDKEGVDSIMIWEVQDYHGR